MVSHPPPIPIQRPGEPPPGPPAGGPPGAADRRVFNRPPRILRELPCEQVKLPAPPHLPSGQRIRLIGIITPLLSAGVYVLVAFFRGGSGGAWLVVPMIAISLVTAGITVFNYFDQRKIFREQKALAEGAFTVALNQKDRLLRDLWLQQGNIRRENDPDLAALFEIVSRQQNRLWERRPGDDDFLKVRIGVGEYPSLTEVIREEVGATSEYTLKLQETEKLYHTVPDVPRTVALTELGSLGIAGDDHNTFAAAQALIWQIVAHHSPDEVVLAAFWHSRNDSAWNWLRMLPHTRSLIGEDQYRLLANFDFDPNDPEDKRGEYFNLVLSEIDRELSQRVTHPDSQQNIGRLPHVVVILPNYAEYGALLEPIQKILQHGRALGASAICLTETVREIPGECAAYLDLTVRPQLVATAGHAPVGGRVLLQSVDLVDIAQCALVAEAMTNIVLPEARSGQNIPHTVNLLKLLNIADAADYDPLKEWRNLPPLDDKHPSGLRPVPIGRTGPRSDDLVSLNLNEALEGVHGMIAGTTGSGKSELLITLLIGLAMLHHPDRLNFMLIDFKGGATFRDLSELPHTTGLITDLEGSQADRALTAINSELDRRKKHLGAYNVPNIKAYRRLRAPGKPPIPNLLIAIDEFDEMVNDHEGVVDELIRVAKQGRSLGVHLLFATQQPSNGKIKPGLKANLTYWLALRVVDPDDSKLMINSRDAAFISNATPGRAYKRVGKDVVRFQSAIVTLPYRSTRDNEGLPYLRLDATGRRISPHEFEKKRLEDRLRREQGQQTSHGSPQRGLTGSFGQPNPHQPTVEPQTDADRIIEAMKAAINAGGGAPGLKTYAAERYPIWEEPLTSTILLSTILAGQVAPAAPDANQERRLLHVPIGYLDDPKNARKALFHLNLSENGSVLAIGAAAAGKTSFLLTCILALASAHAPSEAVFYVIDTQGVGLGLLPRKEDLSYDRMPRLPHIADSLQHSDSVKIERLLNVLADELAEREECFQKTGSYTWQRYRKQNPQKPLPALIVIIDNLLEFAELNPEAVRIVGALMRQGQKSGIHFIMSADRLTSAIPADLRNSVGMRIVMRVNSEDDSTGLINKPFAYRLKPQDYGRGYISDVPLPRELQIAYPTLRDEALLKRQLLTNQQQQIVDLNALKLEEELGASVDMIVGHRSASEPGAPPLKLLPRLIEADFAEWLKQRGEVNPRLALAMDNRTLNSLDFDLAETPHLMICGGPRTGKSNVLQSILASLTLCLPPSKLSLYLIDYRGSGLRSFENLPHTCGYATDTGDLSRSTQHLEDAILRLKQADQGGQPLNQRIIVAISNIDLLETQDVNHLGKLSKWIVQGKRLGVHFLVTSGDFSNSGTVIKQMRQERSVAVLGGAEISNSNIGLSKTLKWPQTLAAAPGRGFLIKSGQERIVQFWHISEAQLATLGDQCMRDPEPPAPLEAPDLTASGA